MLLKIEGVGELPPTQRGVTVGGLVKESNSNTMAASKPPGHNDPLLFFINFESRLTVLIFNKYNGRYHGGTPGI